jgi:hypothetical protein
MSPRDKMVGRIATSLYHLISASQPGVFEELDQTIHKPVPLEVFVFKRRIHAGRSPQFSG